NTNTTTITSPTFNTKQAGELVVVFLSSDGPSGSKQEFSSVTGTGLAPFTLATRANNQAGTAEVWYTYADQKVINGAIKAKLKYSGYHGMIDVVTYTGAARAVGATAAASAPSGGASVNLTTTIPNSIVWAIGNDWDKAVGRTVGINQILSRQFVDNNVGDTFWSQYFKTIFPTAGTAVTANDTAPTKDRWNLAAVEIVPVLLSTTPTSVQTTRYSLWNNDALPTNPADSDTQATEVGVKFRTDTPGKILGIRYYKSATNTGTHIGNLWSNTGTPLATATFTNETSTGWQEISFPTPIDINANTTYVASYHTDTGHYAGDNNYFTGKGVDSGPLHALADGVEGGNGVYKYGASGFPTNTFQASNYWVDVIFETNTAVPSPTQGVSATPTTATSPTQGGPTPTPIPSDGKTNCATKPSSCGYPDETNTGWQHTGVTLRTVVQDPYYVTTPGAVIDGLDIHGCVFVMAKNVTIKRSKITCGAQPMVKNFEPDGHGGLNDIGAGLVIEDVEFDGDGVFDSAGVAFNEYTIRRANFHSIGAAVKLGNNVTIEDSYVHDIASTQDSHNSGFPSDGGVNIKLKHNTVLMNTTNGFPIALYNGQYGDTVVKDVIVDNNLLAGGNYTLYCGVGTAITPNLTVTNNRFSKILYPKGGFYGPTANCSGAALWQNNYWDDNLSPLNP
ncbi:MAG TPA: DUF4082 domain-containing protein, partial [Nitrososphaera sp.]